MGGGAQVHAAVSNRFWGVLLVASAAGLARLPRWTHQIRVTHAGHTSVGRAVICARPLSNYSEPSRRACRVALNQRRHSLRGAAESLSRVVGSARCAWVVLHRCVCVFNVLVFSSCAAVGKKERSIVEIGQDDIRPHSMETGSTMSTDRRILRRCRQLYTTKRRGCYANVQRLSDGKSW